jgi:hypothetical protein
MKRKIKSGDVVLKYVRRSFSIRSSQTRLTFDLVDYFKILDYESRIFIAPRMSLMTQYGHPTFHLHHALIYSLTFNYQ